jgi:hypothetical protein
MGKPFTVVWKNGNSGFERDRQKRRYLCFEFQRGTRRGGETITARAPAESHLLDVSLVYRETSAHLQPEFVIDAAESFLIQHGTAKNESAASSALKAFPFSEC